MKLKAYAKLNLYLNITGVLPDGYHEIETIMQQIDLHDEIELQVYESLSNSVLIKLESGSPIATDEANTAYRAAQAFLTAAEKTAAVKIKINKDIPHEAGLGGASADAAAVLKGLNAYYGGLFTTQELCEIGQTIGADVPFCIVGGRALCTGKGEKIVALQPLEKEKFFVIIKPEFGFSTKQAYRLYDENPKKVYNIKREYYNIFEELHNDSRIAALKLQLTQAGAEEALLTGSGSAVFGVFKNEKQANEAIRSLAIKNKYVRRAYAVN
ncbi:MAG: 4-(cytidine 5'-diphospho)-2-C-methyl-D-erythritol kinase [Oscillospiraceae bacterium]|nr:4-(cytidine 5'-diphospho)-2-C-methyl-D-erythritol kinase [Oscillospiraceae bacterium]